MLSSIEWNELQPWIKFWWKARGSNTLQEMLKKNPEGDVEFQKKDEIIQLKLIMKKLSP